MEIKKQNGSTLISVVILSSIVMVATLNFTESLGMSTYISVGNRDISESHLLAESVMEKLRSDYIYRLDTSQTVRESDCITATVTYDKCEAAALINAISNPVSKLFSYMYYRSGGNSIDQTFPQILQLVANGESVNEPAESIASQKIDTAITKLRINDLFTANFKPRMYIINNTGLLTLSTETEWANETNPEKGAAWIEVVLNESNSNAVDLYIQSAARVGRSVSYLQRYIGSYFPPVNTLGSNLPPLSESSSIDRTRVTP